MLLFSKKYLQYVFNTGLRIITYMVCMRQTHGYAAARIWHLLDTRCDLFLSKFRMFMPNNFEE